MHQQQAGRIPPARQPAHVPRQKATRPRQHTHHVVAHAQGNKQAGGNALVQGLVSAMTESLRLLGVGRQQYEQIAQQTSQQPRLPPGDVQGVMDRLRADYAQLYFVTGLIDDSIYDADCTFIDPTVKFSGLDLWKRNLQLLVPFLIQPDIQLLSLKPLDQQGKETSSGPQQLQAEWTLQITLALPWRPFIDIVGRTVYTLNTEANQVVEHTEYWNVSAVQALLQIITPGTPPAAAASKQKP